jgi:hypothetical protein
VIEANLSKQTEIGGGNTASCGTYLCEAVAFLNANSDGNVLQVHLAK